MLGRALEAAERIGGFVMVHVGNTPSPLPRLLAMLRTGDVVTHCFHGFEDGVLEDSGAVLDGLAEAQGRGVIVDLGHGGGGFSLKAAEKAVASGCCRTRSPATCTTSASRGRSTTCSPR